MNLPPDGAGSRWFLGIDGCRGGWVVVALAEDGGFRFGLHPDLRSVSREYADAALLLIDIPIGLPAGRPRRCDVEARRLLGPSRSSSIFPPPCREALAAADYREASAINTAVLGVRLSRQTFGILPKIREADLWVRSLDAGFEVRESHPELAFRALNGGCNLAYGKKSADGRRERFDVLERRVPGVAVWFGRAREAFRKGDVADDDILDALVLAVTALAGKDRLAAVPSIPERDAQGLPMEIVFAAAE